MANAADGRIVGNVFWGTSGYSIHLYPNAVRMRVARNIIDGGPPSVRGGVLLAGDSSYASSDNVIEFNVIAYADTYNVTSDWEGSTAWQRSCVQTASGKARMATSTPQRRLQGKLEYDRSTAVRRPRAPRLSPETGLEVPTSDRPRPTVASRLRGEP